MLGTDHQRRFMACISAIKAGDTGSHVRDEMAALARSLVADGAAIVVAACTEIPLVLAPGDLDAPLIDSTAVLVARTLDYAFGA